MMPAKDKARIVRSRGSAGNGQRDLVLELKAARLPAHARRSLDHRRISLPRLSHDCANADRLAILALSAVRRAAHSG
jgi:hypothetical protein